MRRRLINEALKAVKRLKRLGLSTTNAIIFLFLFFVLDKIIQSIINRRSGENYFLTCPIRGKIGTKKRDERGFFTEEYYRIMLTESIIKAGFPLKSIDLNYRIRVGHGGKNLIIPDIVLKRRNGKAFAVFEVKKNSNHIKSAIIHQLEPSMRILESDYGAYFDGTKKSIVIRRNGEILRNFNFLNIPN